MRITIAMILCSYYIYCIVSSMCEYTVYTCLPLPLIYHRLHVLIHCKCYTPTFLDILPFPTHLSQHH